MALDPRVSDEATGLPPLDEVDPEDAILVCAWTGGYGVATSPLTGKPEPVRFLSVRGLIRSGKDSKDVSWGQMHLAVPVEHAVDVAASLASGGAFDTEDDDEAPA